jgi:hypothetical protein
MALLRRLAPQAKNSFPFYERIVEVGATDGKHPIAGNSIASIAGTFFAEFGDCTTEDKTCTVYGQNFQAAEMHQINEYWKRTGKPSFQKRMGRTAVGPCIGAAGRVTAKLLVPTPTRGQQAEGVPGRLPVLLGTGGATEGGRRAAMAEYGIVF